MKTLPDFQKTKQYLVCIDSDGCAIDSMNIKHFNCFGPCLVEEWNLEKNKKEILDRWNVINLFSLTRGINRFKGLLMMLEEVNEKYSKIEDLESLRAWVNTTSKCSNGSLIEEIEKTNSLCLKKALSWSNNLNKKITEIPEEEITPFKNVHEALKKAKEKANIVVVSSANLDAIKSEWSRSGLFDEIDCMCSQNDGSKEACIKACLERGFEEKNVIMVGDAPGDHKAALDNHVYFYPILAGHEAKSFKDFIDQYLEVFLNGTFDTVQEDLVDKFNKNLS